MKMLWGAHNLKIKDCCLTGALLFLAGFVIVPLFKMDHSLTKMLLKKRSQSLELEQFARFLKSQPRGSFSTLRRSAPLSVREVLFKIHMMSKGCGVEIVRIKPRRAESFKKNLAVYRIDLSGTEKSFRLFLNEIVNGGLSCKIEDLQITPDIQEEGRVNGRIELKCAEPGS